MILLEAIGFMIAIFGALASVWFFYDRLFPLRKFSWHSAEKAASNISNQMKQQGYSPTIIVGIGRGGAIMGSLISGCLGHRPLLVIDRKYMWMDGRRIDEMVLHLHLPPALVERVLLIAGEAHSGNTMRMYYNFFQQMGAHQIKRSAFFVQKGCTEPLEYIGICSEKNLRMPWMFCTEYIRDDRSEEEAKAIGSCFDSAVGLSESSEKYYYIIRHGESADNEGGDRYSGITESLLTEKGIKQAQVTGRYLQGERIQRIYVSPMKRAITTAREIQAIAGGHLVVDHRLREIDYGEWEGMTRKEVFKKWPKLYTAYKKNPVANTPLGGENPQYVLNRIKDFWTELQTSPATQTLNRIVIVTHNAVSRILLGYLNEIPLENYREMRIDNCSVSKILCKRDGSVNIAKENYIDHLTNEGI